MSDRVRIAVIDSGIHRHHPHISGVAGGVSVDSDGKVDAGDFNDRLGHGTAVMAAIQEKAPAAEYYAVKVFHDSLRTTADALLAAIGWCADENIDLANLSLGTMNPAHAVRFEEAVQHATARGTLLIAARDADGTPCYPGCLPDVIGVSLDWDCPRDQCRLETVSGAPVFYASGYPRPAPGVPPRWNLHGISFAVANMTGIVARLYERGAGVECIRERLVRECAGPR